MGLLRGVEEVSGPGIHPGVQCGASGHRSSPGVASAHWWDAGEGQTRALMGVSSLRGLEVCWLLPPARAAVLSEAPREPAGHPRPWGFG